MKLEEIGFYTLKDDRVKNLSYMSPLQRCELILTHRCNFNCPYCRGIEKENQKHLTWVEAASVVNNWIDGGIQNIRFSGGEPTLWEGLENLVFICRCNGVKRIAVSTNGSADIKQYKRLIKYGVNDFSISLDACCSATGDMMAGREGIWEKVISNIRELSKLTYVTVGIVVTDNNISELPNTIRFAHDLGVSDIRIIGAAQWSADVTNGNISLLGPVEDIMEQHPILNYRINNMYNGREVRGIKDTDNHQCPLVLDDMAVLNGKHYPCIIYMREQGKEIGRMNQSIYQIREERYNWFKYHNCYDDPICRGNCLDVCIDYNNRVRELRSDLR